MARQRDELRAATEENARLLSESRGHAEALGEADRRKDEFLATLAHELRNPLAPIRNAVEVMRGQGLDDPKLEWARSVIDRQVATMARLVDELLDVSRIATGKLILSVAPTDLKTVIDRSIEASLSLIEAKRHRLEVMLPEHTVRLYVDEIRLTQVFANLLTNAAKYTDVGGRIRIIARMIDDEIEVRVEDSGVGIRKEMLAEVFGLFDSSCAVHRSHRRWLGCGTRAGAAVRQASWRNGHCRKRRPGPGQPFIVRLPIRRELADYKPGAAIATPAPATRPQRTSQRVLVVDDNADGATSLAMLLKLMKHETITANTGADGLTAARAVSSGCRIHRHWPARHDWLRVVAPDSQRARHCDGKTGSAHRMGNRRGQATRRRGRIRLSFD